MLRNYKSFLVGSPDPDLWNKIRILTKKDLTQEMGMKKPEIIFKKTFDNFQAKLDKQVKDFERNYMKNFNKHVKYNSFINKIQKLNDQFGL